MRDLNLQWLEAMRAGKLPRAWEITDRLEAKRRARERADGFRWNPESLLWNGESMEGRSVVVFCNHGLGDTLQFARFLPRIGAIAQEVTLLAQPLLVPLLVGMPGFGQVVDGWEKSAAQFSGAIHVEVMELAYALRVALGELGRDVPYLCKRTILERSQLRLGASDPGELRVGLYWQASSWDPTRSVPLPEWAPLGSLPRVTYYSLQPPETPGENRLIEMIPLEAQTGAIPDLACAILQLDLIITVDSMVAHLAGALGRPVWVLLKYDADWRWMMERKDCPWYPSMRLFRQRSPGSWKEALEEVAAELARFSPESPVINAVLA